MQQLVRIRDGAGVRGISRRAPQQHRMHAGEWRGLPVAIKIVLFQSGADDAQVAQVASEAAIASNLSHSNVVATYSHDIHYVDDSCPNELGIFKFYLIQVLQAAHASCGP